jgi:hypothetical protein
MKQSVALITLGTANYERAKTFYELEHQRGAELRKGRWLLRMLSPRVIGGPD